MPTYTGRKRSRSALIVSLVLCVILSGLSFDAGAKVKKTKIRFSHIYSLGPSSHPHVWIEKFRELCSQEFPGQFDIEEYGVSSLYRVTEVSKAAATGSIEVGYWTTAVARFALPKKSQPIATAVGVPGFFGTSGPITVHMFHDFMDTYGQQISKKYYEPLGATARGYWAGNQAFQVVSMKPLQKLEDFKGVSMRAISFWLVTVAKYLGANPISLSTSEVPGALLTGTVDCAITWSDPMWRNKWYKTAPHMLPMKLLPAQGEGGWWWNLKFWNSLPENVRTKFDRFIEQCNTHVKETISLPLAWNQEELFVADGAKIKPWSEQEVNKIHTKVIEPIKKDWREKAGKGVQQVLKWGSLIGKSYTPEKIKNLENKYKGKIYPVGWEHLAKK